jgi:hypothetical protein
MSDIPTVIVGIPTIQLQNRRRFRENQAIKYGDFGGGVLAFANDWKLTTDRAISPRRYIIFCRVSQRL